MLALKEDSAEEEVAEEVEGDDRSGQLGRESEEELVGVEVVESTKGHEGGERPSELVRFFLTGL